MLTVPALGDVANATDNGFWFGFRLSNPINDPLVEPCFISSPVVVNDRNNGLDAVRCGGMGCDCCRFIVSSCEINSPKF